ARMTGGGAVAGSRTARTADYLPPPKKGSQPVPGYARTQTTPGYSNAQGVPGYGAAQAVPRYGPAQPTPGYDAPQWLAGQEGGSGGDGDRAGSAAQAERLLQEHDADDRGEQDRDLAQAGDAGHLRAAQRPDDDAVAHRREQAAADALQRVAVAADRRP